MISVKYFFAYNFRSPKKNPTFPFALSRKFHATKKKMQKSPDVNFENRIRNIKNFRGKYVASLNVTGKLRQVTLSTLREAVLWHNRVIIESGCKPARLNDLAHGELLPRVQFFKCRDILYDRAENKYTRVGSDGTTIDTFDTLQGAHRHAATRDAATQDYEKWVREQTSATPTSAAPTPAPAAAAPAAATPAAPVSAAPVSATPASAAPASAAPTSATPAFAGPAFVGPAPAAPTSAVSGLQHLTRSATTREVPSDSTPLYVLDRKAFVDEIANLVPLSSIVYDDLISSGSKYIWRGKAKELFFTRVKNVRNKRGSVLRERCVGDEKFSLDMKRLLPNWYSLLRDDPLDAAAPAPAARTSATPASAAPASAAPASAAPTSVAPTSVAPTSATPTSATPASATDAEDEVLEKRIERMRAYFELTKAEEELAVRRAQKKQRIS